MGYKVRQDEAAQKQLRKLDRSIQRASVALFERIESLPDPRSIGHGLSGPLAGLWTYVVHGDWRAVASIADKKVTVLVVKIAARDKVYK